MEIFELKRRLEAAYLLQPSLSTPDRARSEWQRAMRMTFSEMASDSAVFDGLNQVAIGTGQRPELRFIAASILGEISLYPLKNGQSRVLCETAEAIKSTLYLQKKASLILERVAPAIGPS